MEGVAGTVRDLMGAGKPRHFGLSEVHGNRYPPALAARSGGKRGAVKSDPLARRLNNPAAAAIVGTRRCETAVILSDG